MSATTTISSTSDIGYDKEKWAKLLNGIALDRIGGVPLHLQLQQSLRQIIQTSVRDGERMPSEDEIVATLQISRATVRRALADIAASGLLIRRRAAGTIVIKPQAAAVANLAVVAPSYSSFVMSGHFAALHQEAEKQNTRINLVSLSKGDDWKSYSKQIDFAPNEGGVVFMSNPQLTTLDLYRNLTQQGYKTVNVAPFIKGYPGSFVSVSNESSVRLGLEYLARMGHEKILFLVTEPEELDEVRERVRYFEQTARTMGLTKARVMHCGLHSWENSSEAASQAMLNVCAEPVAERPTAIFAISDESAMGALFGLVRMGVRVPEDMSILSYDGTSLTRLVQPKLTTLVTPMERVAQEVFEILRSDSATPKPVFVEPYLQEAASVLSPKNT